MPARNRDMRKVVAGRHRASNFSCESRADLPLGISTWSEGSGLGLIHYPAAGVATKDEINEVAA